MRCPNCCGRRGYWETVYVDYEGKSCKNRVWVECDHCNGTGTIDED